MQLITASAVLFAAFTAIAAQDATSTIAAVAPGATGAIVDASLWTVDELVTLGGAMPQPAPVNESTVEERSLIGAAECLKGCASQHGSAFLTCAKACEKQVKREAEAEVATLAKRTCWELTGEKLTICQTACKALCDTGTAGLFKTACKKACDAKPLKVREEPKPIVKRTCWELTGDKLKVCQTACKALCDTGTAGLFKTACKKACDAKPL